jgi:hypothetical protein
MVALPERMLIASAVLLPGITYLAGKLESEGKIL